MPLLFSLLAALSFQLADITPFYADISFITLRDALPLMRRSASTPILPLADIDANIDGHYD